MRNTLSESRKVEVIGEVIRSLKADLEGEKAESISKEDVLPYGEEIKPLLFDGLECENAKANNDRISYQNYADSYNVRYKEYLKNRLRTHLKPPSNFEN